MKYSIFLIVALFIIGCEPNGPFIVIKQEDGSEIEKLIAEGVTDEQLAGLLIGKWGNAKSSNDQQILLEHTFRPDKTYTGLRGLKKFDKNHEIVTEGEWSVLKGFLILYYKNDEKNKIASVSSMSRLKIHQLSDAILKTQSRNNSIITLNKLVENAAN